MLGLYKKFSTAAPKGPVKPSYGKFGKDTLIAHFLRFCKVATRGKLSKKEAKKTPWRKCHHLLISVHLKCHFAANRGFQSARKAELWQIWQGHPIAHFQRFWKVATKGNSSKKKAIKKHPGVNAIIS